jgi:integrase/recombinase XerD
VLTLYRRHLVGQCRHTSRRERRCKCPVWVAGTLRGEKIRRSLDLTSWEAADELVHGWTQGGRIGAVQVVIPTIAEAIEKFIQYTETQNRSWETLRKYRLLLERRVLPWCRENRYLELRHLTVDRLRTFQTTWTDGPVYAGKNIERLRSFFRFCHEAEWITTNPARSLKRPKSKPNPTLPFTALEMKRILAACNKYRGDRNRIKTFILTMRYSGLRIGDTIALERSRLKGSKLLLYTQKTGTPVFVPLPPFVAKALSELANSSERFFWTGKNLRSAVANWSRYLASVFELAKVADAHSHRFRDTFAVSLLEKGVSLENVSILLGHSSLRITERHYSPWVKTRQMQLEAAVAKSWR